MFKIFIIFFINKNIGFWYWLNTDMQTMTEDT